MVQTAVTLVRISARSGLFAWWRPVWVATRAGAIGIAARRSHRFGSRIAQASPWGQICGSSCLGSEARWRGSQEGLPRNRLGSRWPALAPPPPSLFVGFALGVSLQSEPMLCPSATLLFSMYLSLRASPSACLLDCVPQCFPHSSTSPPQCVGLSTAVFPPLCRALCVCVSSPPCFGADRAVGTRGGGVPILGALARPAARCAHRQGSVAGRRGAGARGDGGARRRACRKHRASPGGGGRARHARGC